jgi:hypothetical protein
VISRPSQATRKALVIYCRTIADALGLRDWTLILDYDTPALVDEHARIDCTYGRRRATINWGASFWQQSRSDQRNTIIHELLHIHLDQPAAVVRDIEQQLGTFAFSVFNDNHHRETEIAVDALATAIAGRFPLPPRLRLDP